MDKDIDSMEQISNEVRDLHENVNTLMDDVKEVKNALLGNSYNKTGIIHTIAEHHQRISIVERNLERGKWLVIGLSAGSGIGLYEVLKNLFK
jgi:hypothetical protein